MGRGVLLHGNIRQVLANQIVPSRLHQWRINQELIKWLLKGRKTMRIGAVYPQTEFSNDPHVIRDYAQAVEEMGYTHVLAYDHVLGANPNRPGGWTGPYTHETPFQEPFVLFAFMAAATTTLEFATGIIILPQRQTALVAKQAATLDVLSGGRLRVGVGIGWNEVEYVALNENFRTRGKRMEEQLEVLNLLWTQPLVTFQGKYHTIPDAGLNPMPVQQPIPLWFGGHAEAMLRRCAKWGAGWMPNYRTVEQCAPALKLLGEFLSAEGRSSRDFGLEPRISYGKGDEDQWRKLIDEWQGVGASHLTVNTMGSGFKHPDEHIKALRHFAERMLPTYANQPR
jgi:probable F420-dependent oxidoreductase